MARRRQWMKETHKKVLKNPMFIGATAGLSAAVFWTVFFVLFDTMPEILTEVVMKFIFYVSFPIYCFTPIPDFFGSLGTLTFAIFFSSLYVWYVQLGFFSGLLYRFCRKRYTKKRSWLILLAAIAILFAVNFYVNREWW
jgi:hypothetical protein